MTPEEERLYMQGLRSAYLEMIAMARRALGMFEDDEAATAKQIARLIEEREWTISKLRNVCGSFGDNEWPHTLWIPDIIEKHLADYLYESGLGAADDA